ncbi:type IV secretion system protein [Burkholderia stagnalis]
MTSKDNEIIGRDGVASDDPPRGPRAESYESIRISRNRAYLLALAAWPVAALAIAVDFENRANEGYVPPVVLTLDANNHVAKSEIGTPGVLGAKDALVEGEIARYFTERFTLDRQFRDDHIRYVVLHSSSQVAAQYQVEMDPNNTHNPYYSIPDGLVRRVKELRIRVLDKEQRKIEVTFTTYVDGAKDGPTEYWHSIGQYDFVKQALTPADRYINGTGFVMTALETNNEPGPRQ